MTPVRPGSFVDLNQISINAATPSEYPGVTRSIFCRGYSDFDLFRLPGEYSPQTSSSLQKQVTLPVHRMRPESPDPEVGDSLSGFLTQPAESSSNLSGVLVVPSDP